jgi:alpha-glucuronidase
VRDRLANRATVGDTLLLWFHRVRWDERLPSGRTLWDELVHRYQAGVDTVRSMRRTWDRLETLVDAERFRETQAFLAIQEQEAQWWRDASIAYFQTFSRRPLPPGIAPPPRPLEYYRSIVHRYAF